MEFDRWLTSIADGGLSLIGRLRREADPLDHIKSLCLDLVSNKGEALGTALAREVTRTYGELASADQLAFFIWLKDELSPSPDEIIEAANAYATGQTPETMASLMQAVEPPRQQLFRRINMAPDGTTTLVKLREHLRDAIRTEPELAIVDVDLQHLMVSWFNRGFLELRPINWQTSADILEKIISYESVHRMSGWRDLKRRLANDRRCFAFFHPAMPDEPLIFVEIALLKGIAPAIAPILDEAESILGNANTAIFYGISNCQAGLVGISFGNFLIKQVVMELREELPQLKHFATLSPIPGFRRWLSEAIESDAPWISDNPDMEYLRRLEQEGKVVDAKPAIKRALIQACARYLYLAKRGAVPLDPVARFHLGNGATIERINYLGDTSDNGIQTSWGMLVNYRYELSKVEQNHEAFVNEGTIATSPGFRKLLQGMVP